MPKGAATASSKAAIGYEYRDKLFALEKKSSEMSDSVRKTARQVKAGPLLEAYGLWLKTLDPVLGSKLAEAVAYAQNQKLCGSTGELYQFHARALNGKKSRFGAVRRYSARIRTAFSSIAVRIPYFV